MSKTERLRMLAKERKAKREKERVERDYRTLQNRWFREQDERPMRVAAVFKAFGRDAELAQHILHHMADRVAEHLPNHLRETVESVFASQERARRKQSRMPAVDAFRMEDTLTHVVQLHLPDLYYRMALE